MNLSEEFQSCESIVQSGDFTFHLPDESLACIFQLLSSADRNRCSLVCRRWLRVDGQSRHRLSLNGQSEILVHLPSLFTRFDSVTKLALRCNRKSVSVNDDALTLISIRCPNLIRLKLRGCREVTDLGMANFAKNCKGLKKFSCGSCTFGANGMNAVLDNCSALEELSVKRLRGINASTKLIGPGVASSSLKIISLKELYNGQSFEPLITGSNKLKTLKVYRCSGDWDHLLEKVGNHNSSLVEIHLERLQVSDVGLSGLSNCLSLEILHIVKTPECSNVGLILVAVHCKLLRKLHIDGWRTNKIGDEGLVQIAKHCPNLQELVLIGVNPTCLSLTELASHCQNLERLALCGSNTIGDAEILCVAAKCVALRKLCIKGCPITDKGMEALSWGFPNLVKVKVKKCSGVTSEVASLLQANRGSLIVNLDVCEAETMEASGSDVGGVHPFPPLILQVNNDDPQSSRNGPLAVLKARFGILSAACTFRRLFN